MNIIFAISTSNNPIINKIYDERGGVSTGGVSYTVGGAAAPLTLSSATPTIWLATPIFNGFFGFPTSKCSRKPRDVP